MRPRVLRIGRCQNPSTLSHFDLTPEQRREFEWLRNDLARAFGESFVASGQIDPRGKSQEAIDMEVASALAQLVSSPEFNVTITIDHTTSILDEARRHRARGREEFTLVFCHVVRALAQLVCRPIRAAKRPHGN